MLHLHRQKALALPLIISSLLCGCESRPGTAFRPTEFREEPTNLDVIPNSGPQSRAENRIATRLPNADLPKTEEVRLAASDASPSEFPGNSNVKFSLGNSQRTNGQAIHQNNDGKHALSKVTVFNADEALSKTTKLSTNRIAEAIRSLAGPSSISEEEWASADDELISEIITMMLQAEIAGNMAMSINASNAALMDAARRDNGRRFDDRRMDSVEQAGMNVVRKNALTIHQLQSVITKLGPRTAPALLAAGESNLFREQFGESATPYLVKVANDPSHPLQAVCWIYGRVWFPNELESEAPIDKLLAIAKGDREVDCFNALYLLSLQPKEHDKIADIIREKMSSPLNSPIMTRKDLMTVMLRLKTSDPQQDDNRSSQK